MEKLKINVQPGIIGNIRGSFWELGGTNWEEGGKKTKNPSHPIRKRKRTSPSRGHAKPSHRLQEIYLSKIVGQHHFPRLRPCRGINFFSIFAFVSF
jgi:hypothetical protein